IICKRWLMRVHDELCTRFRYGWDGDVVIVLWIHDELVCCSRPEIAEAVGEILVRHAKEPGEFYNFQIPLDADYKVGRSWAGDPAGARFVMTREPASVQAFLRKWDRKDRALYFRPRPSNPARRPGTRQQLPN